MRTTRRGFLGALTAATYARVAGANDRVQLGFIGYGLIGKQHVLDFRKLADVDCAAVAEVHAGRLDAGASAVQVGTALLHDPTTVARLRAALTSRPEPSPEENR